MPSSRILADDVGDVGVPVAHADVDRQVDGGGEVAALLEGPASEWRTFGERRLLEADLGVAVLELFDDGLGQGPAVGYLGEIFSHLGEDVGGSVGEQEDGLDVWHVWSLEGTPFLERLVQSIQTKVVSEGALMRLRARCEVAFGESSTR